MANPTQAQIDKLTTNATRWDNIINGSASATVALDSFTVKTVAGYLQDLQATNPRGAWGTGTEYALKDVVVESSIVYICTIAHTGGTFATDLAAGKWAVYQLDVTSAITFGDDFTVDTNTLHVDSTNNRVGIGTTSAIETNQAGIGKLSVENNSWNLINTVTYNSSANVAPFLGLTKARGTQSSPSPVQDGDLLGALFAAGYNGSNYGSNADISFYQDGTLNGGKIIISTSPEGTSSPQDRICIDAAGKVGIGTISPNAASILDITSTTKGFLPPRMSATQRDAISTPPAGLIIYNHTTGKLNLYTSSWEEITST